MSRTTKLLPSPSHQHVALRFDQEGFNTLHVFAQGVLVYHDIEVFDMAWTHDEELVYVNMESLVAIAFNNKAGVRRRTVYRLPVALQLSAYRVSCGPKYIACGFHNAVVDTHHFCDRQCWFTLGWTKAIWLSPTLFARWCSKYVCVDDVETGTTKILFTNNDEKSSMSFCAARNEVAIRHRNRISIRSVSDDLDEGREASAAAAAGKEHVLEWSSDGRLLADFGRVDDDADYKCMTLVLYDTRTLHRLRVVSPAAKCVGVHLDQLGVWFTRTNDAVYVWPPSPGRFMTRAARLRLLFSLLVLPLTGG